LDGKIYEHENLQIDTRGVEHRELPKSDNWRSSQKKSGDGLDQWERIQERNKLDRLGDTRKDIEGKPRSSIESITVKLPKSYY
jgi:hypothetical protein